MSEKDDHILAVVEDTLDGYEKLFDADEMELMRVFLATTLKYHPVISQFTDEQVPRPQAPSFESHEVPTNVGRDQLKAEYDAWMAKQKKGA